MHFIQAMDYKVIDIKRLAFPVSAFITKYYRSNFEYELLLANFFILLLYTTLYTILKEMTNGEQWIKRECNQSQHFSSGLIKYDRRL